MIHILLVESWGMFEVASEGGVSCLVDIYMNRQLHLLFLKLAKRRKIFAT